MRLLSQNQNRVQKEPGQTHIRQSNPDPSKADPEPDPEPDPEQSDFVPH